MKKNIKTKLSLSIYLTWPLILSVILIFINVCVYIEKQNASNILLIFTIIYILIALYLLFIRYRKLLPRIFSLIMSTSNVQNGILDNINIPFALCTSNGTIIWENKSFKAIRNKRGGIIPNINFFSKTITKELLYDSIKNRREFLVDFQNKIYNILLEGIDITKEWLNNIEEKEENNDSKVIAIYATDVTDLENAKRNLDDYKTVEGLIYVDNYEEALENIEDTNKSIITALVDRKLTRYVSDFSGIIKRLEKDKYLFIINKKNIKEMIEDRFSLLDTVKEINTANDISMTLSIGVGMDGKSIEENYDFARYAIDMALGRGGDQAVVKNNIDMQYYGGKTLQQEKFTRVRSRVKAKAFREVLDTKDKILIMGHKNVDFDSFGASVGVYMMAKFIGKDVHIVQNSIAKGVNVLKEKFLSQDEYASDMFIDGDHALFITDEDTMLILVDHNNPKISDEPRLIEKISTKVVFDHHRRGKDTINDAVLQHIEPNSSSASELVSEMTDYFDDKFSLRPLEAESMLIGIIVDTNYFSNQTSAKTFDAASSLKKMGADIGRIRNMLQVDEKSENLKNESLLKKEIYKNNFAIAVVENKDNVDNKIVAAEVANELMHIKGIDASIVLTKFQNSIYISARAIDRVNVQVLMEELGGGGHKSVAASQLNDITIEEAIWKVKDAIDQILSEN
ncbi:MAG: DHH family phosphoesterase [Eubacteriales bacterium]|nr:DHH family phosphoesterase [Eubacteriales bacterium]